VRTDFCTGSTGRSARAPPRRTPAKDRSTAASARSVERSPVSTTVKFSAVYQRSKNARTRSFVKERTLSREPRIGER
jgi:hypothetical protein